MSQFLAPKRVINFCPLCGLIADHTQKGEWCYCPSCHQAFRVFVKKLSANMMGDERRNLACSNKIRYETLEDTWQAWQEIKERQVHNNSDMTVYLCDLCGCFHLGHAPKNGSPYHSQRKWTMPQLETELHLPKKGDDHA